MACARSICIDEEENNNKEQNMQQNHTRNVIIALVYAKCLGVH